MSAPLPTPGERLALSRERLRVALAQQAAPGTRAGHAAHGAGLGDVLKAALPGASAVVDALGQWWARHPLHSTGMVAAYAAQAALRPLAQRHPLALAGGAVVLGALLAWTRPWRWLLRPAWLNTLGPTLLSSALASGAVEAWLLAALARNTTPAQAPSSPPE